MLNYVNKGLILSVCSRMETSIEEPGAFEAKYKCCHLTNLLDEEQLSFSQPDCIILLDNLDSVWL